MSIDCTWNWSVLGSIDDNVIQKTMKNGTKCLAAKHSMKRRTDGAWRRIGYIRQTNTGVKTLHRSNTRSQIKGFQISGFSDSGLLVI